MAAAVEQVELIKTDALNNSNKYYSMTLQHNGDVVCRWGRVGAKGETQTHHLGGIETLRRIEKAKMRKGYQRVATAASQSGTAPAAVVRNAARTELSDGNPVTDNLISLLASVNRHAIQLASGGMITATASEGVQTARGPVSSSAISEARSLLVPASTGTVSAIDRYLMLVPQVMPHKAGWHTQFADADFLASQREFLDQLDAAVAMSDGTAGAAIRFRYRLTTLDDSDDRVSQLRTRFESSRNSRHHDVSRLKLRRAWLLTDNEDEAWNQALARLGSWQRQLWHGTLPANVLSILHRGLYVPPETGSTVQITGRMFGAGVYLSDQSSKSLRYSYGSWSGTRQDHCYMLSADVAMGHELRTRAGDDRYDVMNRMKSGRYDSLVVKAGTCGVMNNEVIVPDAGQVSLKYLCEFR